MRCEGLFVMTPIPNTDDKEFWKALAAANEFWRLPRVLLETGLTRSVIYQKMAAGEFPDSFKLTERCVAWKSGEVQRWKAQRLVAAGKLTEVA